MSFMCGSKIILQGGGKGGVHWDNLVFGTRTEGGGGGRVRSLFSVILFYYVNLISFIFRDESGPPPSPFSSFNLRMRFGDSNCNTDRLIFLIF